jgi:hypothetical protein
VCDTFSTDSIKPAKRAKVIVSTTAGKTGNQRLHTQIFPAAQQKFAPATAH